MTSIAGGAGAVRGGQVGDCNGELTARLNLADLQSTFGVAQASEPVERVSPDSHDPDSDSDSQGDKMRPRRRLSMENMELMHLTPGKVGKPLNGDVTSLAAGGAPAEQQQNSVSAAAVPASSRPSGKSLLPSRLRSRKQRDGGGAETEQRAATVDSHDVTLQVPARVDPDLVDDDGFFDLLSRFQGNRMDDQRCSLGPDRNGASAGGPSTPPLADRRAGARVLVASPQTEEFLDLLVCSQSRRIDDQRASVSDLPGLRLTPNNSGAVSGRLAAADVGPAAPRGLDGAAAAAAAAARTGALAATGSSHEHEDEDFFDMLVRCQSSRMDDQRCMAPVPMPRGPTVPDEDFISLIQRVQARRLDEQRVAPPPDLRE